MKKKTQEDHAVVKFFRENWSILVACVGLIAWLATLSLTVSNLSLEVKAKADKEVISSELKAINNQLDKLQNGMDRMIQLHIK